MSTATLISKFDLMKKTLAVVLFALISCVSFAQLTIINIPSADVMDKGKVYFRGDSFYFPSSEQYSFNPNFMVGVGSGLELDLSAVSLSTPGTQVSVVPGAKYAFIRSKSFTAFVGDQLYLPVHNKTYGTGNYLYAAGAFSFKDTRLTGGAWNSQNVVTFGNRTGALLGLEQTILKDKTSHRALVTPAVDWSSGKGGNGYLSFGAMIYPTKRLMLVPAYQVGNSGIDRGNHGAELFIGFNLN